MAIGVYNLLQQAKMVVFLSHPFLIFSHNQKQLTISEVRPLTPKRHHLVLLQQKLQELENLEVLIR